MHFGTRKACRVVIEWQRYHIKCDGCCTLTGKKLHKGRGPRAVSPHWYLLLSNQLRTKRDVKAPAKRIHCRRLPTDLIIGGALAFLGSFSDIIYEAYALPRRIARNMSEISTPSLSDPRSTARTLALAKSEPPLYRTRYSAMPSMKDGKAPIDCPGSIDHRLAMSGDIALTSATGIGQLTKAVLDSTHP